MSGMSVFRLGDNPGGMHIFKVCCADGTWLFASNTADSETIIPNVRRVGERKAGAPRNAC